MRVSTSWPQARSSIAKPGRSSAARSAEYSNPGDRLYAEGMIKRSAKAKELERLKKAEEDELIRNCTFRPVISNLAQKLVSKGERAAWERLHENARRKQETVKTSQEARGSTVAGTALPELWVPSGIETDRAMGLFRTACRSGRAWRPTRWTTRPPSSPRSIPTRSG